MMENAKIGKSSNETFWVIFKHCVYVCDCYTLENGCYLGIQKRVSSSCYSSKLSVIGLKLNPFVHFIYHPAVKMTVKHIWKIPLEIKLHELSFSFLTQFSARKKAPKMVKLGDLCHLSLLYRVSQQVLDNLSKFQKSKKLVKVCLRSS